MQQGYGIIEDIFESVKRIKVFLTSTQNLDLCAYKILKTIGVLL